MRLVATIDVLELRKAVKESIYNIFTHSKIAEDVYFEICGNIEESFDWHNDSISEETYKEYH